MFLKAYTNAFLMLTVILFSWSFGWSDTIIVYPLERRPIYPSKGVGPTPQELPYAECGTALEATSVDIVWYYVISSEGHKGYIQKRYLTHDKTLAESKCIKPEPIEEKIQTSGFPPLVYVTIETKLYEKSRFRGNPVCDVYPGDTLIVDGQEGLWYRVKTKGSNQGWIAQKWVTTDKGKAISLIEERKRQAEEKKRLEEQRKRAEQQLIEEENKRFERGYSIKLIDWHWSHDKGYVIAIGHVKNISNRRIRNLKVVVTWYDSGGRMITYDTSYVEYTSLMPKQETPFKVIERYNPLMDAAQIDFILNGERVQWYKDN